MKKTDWMIPKDLSGQRYFQLFQNESEKTYYLLRENLSQIELKPIRLA